MYEKELASKTLPHVPTELSIWHFGWFKLVFHVNFNFPTVMYLKMRKIALQLRNKTTLTELLYRSIGSSEIWLSYYR
jgi:hypothetical protein